MFVLNAFFPPLWLVCTKTIKHFLQDHYCIVEARFHPWMFEEAVVLALMVNQFAPERRIFLSGLFHSNTVPSQLSFQQESQNVFWVFQISAWPPVAWWQHHLRHHKLLTQQLENDLNHQRSQFLLWDHQLLKFPDEQLMNIWHSLKLTAYLWSPNSFWDFVRSSTLLWCSLFFFLLFKSKTAQTRLWC